MFDSKSFLKTLPSLPGVYQMYNALGDVLYVGKARRLNQRLKSYFQGKQIHPKTASLVSQIDKIKITVTHSEQEALLLENTLIKNFRPRYNVLFRDDKSYPYIFISKHPDYPRMDFYRGNKKKDGYYFGPYPSAHSVSHAIKTLQKLFRIRQCSDHFFAHRTRPCLQYQIKRCSAPCVKFIDQKNYQQDVQDTASFLEGKKDSVLKNLIARMNEAAANLNFEIATQYRDTISQLRRMQEQQFVIREDTDIDVVVAGIHSQVSCIQILIFRKGELLGNQAYFPQENVHATKQELLQSFLLQHYLSESLQSKICKKIIINEALKDRLLIQKILSEHAHHAVKIIHQPQKIEAGFLRIALTNLEHSLQAHLSSQDQIQSRWLNLQEALHLKEPPHLMQCFDISHTQGEEPVASCVSFIDGHCSKAHYRRFNIRDIIPGDDYGAIYQAIFRHFQHLKTHQQPFPDLLFIDGGKGQLSSALRALENLEIKDIQIVAIAKGVERKAGEERLFTPGSKEPLCLPHNSPALHLIQQIRDEAHRFAIVNHRKKRAKKRIHSVLETIAGVGPKRRRALLQYFGGLQEIAQASIDEINKVEGISPQLAKKIYDAVIGHVAWKDLY